MCTACIYMCTACSFALFLARPLCPLAWRELQVSERGLRARDALLLVGDHGQIAEGVERADLAQVVDPALAGPLDKPVLEQDVDALEHGSRRPAEGLEPGLFVRALEHRGDLPVVVTVVLP